VNEIARARYVRMVSRSVVELRVELSWRDTVVVAANVQETLAGCAGGDDFDLVLAEEWFGENPEVMVLGRSDGAVVWPRSGSGKTLNERLRPVEDP
jgi:hypothetical protein